MSEKINQVEPNISNTDIEKINEYLHSNSWITEHKVTQELENSISTYVDRKYAVAVPNGTIAIYLALLVNGIEKGQKVAVPNITMIATINAIIWAGADPVIIDVDESLCMSLESLQSVKNIDAVIYVPLNGRTNNAKEIENYCKTKNIILIEDSAHALGSSYIDSKCGSLGSTSILSFTPHKIITMGQGGMVLLDDPDTFQKLIDIKTFNREKDKSDVHKGFGLNFKITDLQASLGLSQFNNLEKFIKLKKDIYKQYSNLLKNGLLKSFTENETPWFIDLFCDNKKQRRDLSEFLNKQNIETRFSYPALSSQNYLKNINKANLGYSEQISENILWLPSSTNLSNENIEYISHQINSFFEK
jgi:perosamine synthetase|tara:strand:+ start:7120 stop:8199 length:1080 start_codon:yes stop_codon:yes gene_type:complete